MYTHSREVIIKQGFIESFLLEFFVQVCIGAALRKPGTFFKP